ncbi:tRNA(Ile)-lysidine synthase [Acrasis kona]|uniref:tRNA(Ile)-lysidine synthase n=1 Tax=Acrasis kona TaxID=1008807 RepID=A0AAW2ZQH6_9EUKA
MLTRRLLSSAASIQVRCFATSTRYLNEDQSNMKKEYRDESIKKDIQKKEIQIGQIEQTMGALESDAGTIIHNTHMALKGKEKQLIGRERVAQNQSE